MSSERVNWPVAAGITTAGLLALVLGLSLSNDTTEAWSSVFIQVGIAIGLVAVLVYLERRVVRRVAASTARAESERATADLRGRIERLEDVDVAQRQERAEHQRLARERTEAIRNGDISPSTVGELLVEALRDRLIEPAIFHVRTSQDPACPVLYMTPSVNPDHAIFAVYLDFEPIIDSGRTIMDDGTPVNVPEKTDSTVMWTAGEDAGKIGADLQDGLDRRNKPAHGFGFRHAIEMLLSSVDVMRAARNAPASSPRRLEGHLRVLINDEWAYTSAGLEAVSEETIFRCNPRVLHSGGGSSVWVGDDIHMDEEQRSEADSSLMEALTWVQERESVRLLEPGTAPGRDDPEPQEQ